MASRRIQEAHLRDTLTKRLPTVTWTKIESGSTVNGIPDLYGIVDGVERWIETKIIEKDLARVLDYHKEHLARGQLTGPQRNWHRAHQAAGGVSWIVATVRSLPYGSSLPLWIWAGTWADELHHGKCWPLHFAGAVGANDWLGVAAILFHRRKDEQ